MAGPIVIKDPTLLIQKLDEAGDPDGAPVDVSEDVTAVELAPEQDINKIQTFAGSFSIPGAVTSTATVSIVVGADTNTNWAALVGASVEFQLMDRADATKYRAWRSEVPYDPSLYGSTTPGEAREVDMEVPVYGDIAWVTVTP